MGDLTLHVVRRKVSKPMTPLTREKKVAATGAPAGRWWDFPTIRPTEAAQNRGECSATSAGGFACYYRSVSVRSTPYLSEVLWTEIRWIHASEGKSCRRETFVSGGEIRLQSWTKEITITVGSELTLDATLDKK